MKKLTNLLLIFAAVLSLAACGSDSEDEPTNSLKGTSWSSSYADELFVIKFESNDQVSGYRADSNGNIKGSVYYGTYTLNGDNIVLNDFSIVNFYRFYFTDGVIKGNNMVLNYWWEMGASGEKVRFDEQKTFHKR